ncbi:MAG: SDR family NAD(P)-dependent oxidoreductase [Hyphomicrobiaceae bacterium]
MTSYLDGLFGLHGRTALVTGASSGIGRRMAETLARAGASVVLVARRASDLGTAVAAIHEAGGAAASIVWDVGELASLKDLAKAAAKPFGAPTIVVNAAGLNARQSADDYTIEAWETTLRVNLSAPFFLTQALVPAMRDKGAGNIINIASLQSYRALANGTAYGASKGGIAQLTRAMAEAWSRHGIIANAIQPGYFATELTAAVVADKELWAHHARATCIGRNGELPDLDGITVFLASRGAAYITGQVIGVDGGYTAK